MQIENKNEGAEPLLSKRCMSLDPKYYDERDKELSNWTKWREVYFSPITEGSLRASIMCLITITLGTNLLMLPYTMMTTGVVLCLIMFFTSALITQWSMSLIAEVAIKERNYNFPELVEMYYSKNIVNLTIIMCLANNVGSIMAWDKFITNLVADLIQYEKITYVFISPEITKYTLSILIVIFIQVPICSLNSISRLHVLSVSASVLILYVILVAIFEFPYFFEINFAWEKISYFNFNIDFIRIFCIFFFAFGNHSTIMNALEELQPKTDRRIYQLTTYTANIEMVLYLVTMMVGYFSTFDMTNEIFIIRDYQSGFMTAGKILYIGVMICNVCLYFYMIKPFLEYKFDSKNNKKK